MKKFIAIALCSLPLAAAQNVYAQSAGSTSGSAATAPEPARTLPAESAMPAAPDAGPQASQSGDALTGLSVKDTIMGKTVYNDNDEKIGDINDVIISHDGKSSYIVVGAGGFIGMGEHNVALPFDKISRADKKLILSGYTKDQLKAMPAFTPAK